MSASIGNFQVELENSLKNAISTGVFHSKLKNKSEEYIFKTYGRFSNIQGIEWISAYFDNCHKLNGKSSDNATRLRTEGNKLFQNKMYRDSVCKYTEAVIHASSEDLSLAYGNRSAALYRMELYKDCLVDIKEAIHFGFPAVMRHKLLLRKAHCLNHLGLQEEATACLAELQLLLPAVDASKKDSILKEIGLLHEKTRNTCARRECEGDSVIPSVSYDSSDVLVQASSAVRLECTKEQGRFLVASRNVKVGDTLIVERPFAAVLLPDQYLTHCHHCFSKLHIVYPCGRCTLVRYCSPHCVTSSLNQYHSIECYYLQLLHSVGIAHLSLRVVLVAGLKYLLEFRENQMRLCKVQKLPGLDENGRYCGTYQPVYDLMTHAHDMSCEDLFQYTMTAQLLLKILKHSGWFRIISTQSIGRKPVHTSTQTMGSEPVVISKEVIGQNSAQTGNDGEPVLASTEANSVEPLQTTTQTRDGERTCFGDSTIRHCDTPDKLCKNKHTAENTTSVDKADFEQYSGDLDSTDVVKECKYVELSGDKANFEQYSGDLDSTDGVKECKYENNCVKNLESTSVSDKLRHHCDGKSLDDTETGRLVEHVNSDLHSNSTVSERQDGVDIEAEGEELYIGSLLLRHILQLVCNAHAITELQCSQIDDNNIVDERSQVRVATAIYPTASLMNHSCEPTVIHHFCKDVLVVRSGKDVPAGGEIFNCYGPHYKRMGFTERQQCLKEQYFFTCRCKPCLEGETSEARFLGYRCASCCGPVVRTKSSDYVCEDCGLSNVVDVDKAAQADRLFQKGLAFLQDNKVKDAIKVLKQCYSIRKAVLYKHNIHLSEVQDCLARCHAMSGNFTKSVRYLRESVTTVGVIYGDTSVELAHELQKLSEALIHMQNWKEALTANEKACYIFQRNYGKSHDIVKELLSTRKELLQVVKS